MKKINIIILLSILIPLRLSADPQRLSKESAMQLWDLSNRSYSEGNFLQATEGYEQLEREGVVEKSLFYNMANSYYKQRMIGKSILYYERVLKLDPSDNDAINNIKIVRDLTIDKIDQVPDFILKSWIKDLNYSLSSNFWSVISLIALLLSLSMLIVFKYGKRRGIRRLAFIGSIIFGTIWLCSISFAWNQKSHYFSSDNAIVIQSVSAVRSSPDNSAQSLFILHEGAKIGVIERLSEWTRIELPDGRQGWIGTADIGII